MGRGVAAALFLIDSADDQVSLFKRCADFFGKIAIFDFYFLLAFAHEPRVKLLLLGASKFASMVQ